MKGRLFVTCWILIALHFATNIVREHYPAFALVDHGNFQCDEYAGFHSDIFEHRDGHHYVGNQVLASVVAAAPLLLFDPLLDYVQERSLARRRANPGQDREYDTEYVGRQEFFRKVQERGLAERFGLAAALTTTFVMAPLAAWCAVLVFSFLCARGVARGRALWLALLFTFGTPVFYRAVSLNHNFMLMLVTFGAFLVLWPQPPREGPLSARRRFAAGVLTGATLAFDYVGAVLIPCLFAYLLWTHARPGGIKGALRAAPAFVLGTLPPVLFLWGTQWWMYGDPFKPGQAWMPVQNQFVEVGARGMTLPDPQVFWQNLAAPAWGLFVFGPLFVLAFVPALYRPPERRVLPPREQVFVAGLSLVFMLFCAMNQYSRLQWNTGFRYLLPLVPFLFLALADHLVRAPRAVLAVVTAAACGYTWVLTTVRYTPPTGPGDVVGESFRRVFADGLQFPWLSVVRRTGTSLPLAGAAWFPWALLAATAVVIALVWCLPLRRAAGSTGKGV